MATMLTISEAAQALGVKPATVRSWIWKRKIEYVKVSRSVRIPLAVVQQLIKNGTRAAVSGFRG